MLSFPLLYSLQSGPGGHSLTSKMHDPFSTRCYSCSEVMAWAFSNSSFRMPKPHETHNTKGWYSTSWYSMNWHRFISLLSLCFNLLTLFEEKKKAPAPKEKQEEQQRSSLFYSHRLSARSAFIHPPASSKNSILHQVPNFSEKQFYIYTWPGLNVYCWKTNSCADPILMTVKS